jgi:hypothetical protein
MIQEMEGKEILRVDVHNHHALLELGWMLKTLIDLVEGLANHHSVVGGVEELERKEKY